MSDHMLSSLRERLQAKEVIVVVGAGAALGASTGNPLAGWKGLLEHGLQRCAEVVPGVRPSWLERSRAQLSEAFEHGEMDEILAVATAIEQRLNREPGEYSLWLKQTVGSLSLNDSSAINAIRALRCPIVTTNYDTLIERVTGYGTATLQDPNRVLATLRGEEDNVIHLHGVWNRPDTVALGSGSYANVLSASSLQSIQRSLASTKSLLFIGCGGGLNDPNLGSLFSWYRETFKGSLETRHYRLARSAEVQGVSQQHETGDRVMVIPFGEEHSELPGFLEGIVGLPQFSATPAPHDLIREEDTLDDLINHKPHLWEYLYLSRILSAELAARQDLKRTLTRRLHFASNARVFNEAQAMMSWISAKLHILGKITEGLTRLSNEDIQEAAGREGEHGDPELLRHCAMRIAAAYQGLIEWSLDFVGVVPPGELFDNLLDLTSQFSQGTIEGIESFSTNLSEGLRDAMADPHTERTIQVTLELKIQESLSDCLSAEIRRVGDLI